jgi:hypothetical protein
MGATPTIAATQPLPAAELESRFLEQAILFVASYLAVLHSFLAATVNARLTSSERYML